jgi:hypothetical protein
MYQTIIIAREMANMASFTPNHEIKCTEIREKLKFNENHRNKSDLEKSHSCALRN